MTRWERVSICFVMSGMGASTHERAWNMGPRASLHGGMFRRRRHVSQVASFKLQIIAGAMLFRP